MGVVKASGLFFLKTISRNIMYRTVDWVANHTSAVYRSVLDNVFQVFNRVRFNISTINCVNELRPLMDGLHNT